MMEHLLTVVDLHCLQETEAENCRAQTDRQPQETWERDPRAESLGRTTSAGVRGKGTTRERDTRAHDENDGASYAKYAWRRRSLVGYGWTFPHEGHMISWLKNWTKLDCHSPISWKTNLQRPQSTSYGFKLYSGSDTHQLFMHYCTT